MYWDILSGPQAEELEAASWQSDLDIRHYINLQISGDQGVWPVEWFHARFTDRLPFDKGLVIGGGTGELERVLVERGIARHVTAVDLSLASVLAAKAAAHEAGFGDNIRYVVTEGTRYLASSPPRSLSAVFFHGSLHHFANVREILELTASRLEPGGILYLDEYVGPSMHQWNTLLLAPANLAYYLLPRSARRPRLVRAPFNPSDPTESVNSAAILGEVARVFHILERRDYGGNLLSLIYPNLEREATRLPSRRAVRRLIYLEKVFRSLTKHVRNPFYALLVARPKAD